MMRVARSPEGSAVYDPTRRIAGRGAYLCYNRKCVDIARKRHAIERALKVVTTDSLWEELERALEEHIANKVIAADGRSNIK
jgi:predicted RNA-binding protein YlxR (DUF448 family)